MSDQLFIAVGGTEDCRGGAEVFMNRLAAVWPETGLGSLVTFPANTAWGKSSRRLLASVFRWLCTMARIAGFIAVNGLRRGTRVTVWYHYSNGVDLFALLWLSLWPRVRIVVTPHCSLTWKHLASGYGRRLTLRILRRVGLILVLSEEQRQFFECSGSPVTRMRTLLPENSLQRVPFQLRPVASFVYVGRVTREKGVAQMVELMRLLCRALPGAKLDIFGEADEEMTAFLAEAQRQDPVLGSAMRVLGAVPQQRVAAELGRCRYLLHLSRVDAFPLAVLEAVVAGTVPVVFGLPGTAEIIARWGGISTDSGDIERLAQAIVEVERDGRIPPVRSEEAAEYYGSAAVARELRSILGGANA